WATGAGCGGRPAGVRPALDLRVGACAPREGSRRRAAYGRRGPRTTPRRGAARGGRGRPPGRGAPERTPGRGVAGRAVRTAGHSRPRGPAWSRRRHGGSPPPPRPADRLSRAGAGPGVGLVVRLATLRRSGSELLVTAAGDAVGS